MPTDYRVLKNGTLVVERWTGTIYYEDLTQSVIRRAHDASVAPGASVLADSRTATFEIEEDRAREAAERVHSSPEDRMKDSRVALVVREDALVRANMFASQSAAYGVNVMVFEHFDVACTWLELNPTEMQSLLDEIRG